MPAPEVLRELVERFDAHKDAYRSAEYNEAQLREEFLNPLFEALGWDVHNRKGYAAPYKEVIHEDAIKIGGRTKAPDYCFRAGGGMRSFFVEAKKPSVDISEAAGPAYQLRRYAWSAKLPVSILTDFEELAVYDCRIRPERTDKASTARIMLRKYNEYLDCWDELVALFSPEAIRRGSLERLVASKRIKKGTAEVDAAFLDEIESWRTDLARNMALRNPDLSQRDLNYAVQRTIDRIIFLRICEDRGIEPYGTLESLQNAPGIYPRLGELFQRADDRYNSGLFHFTAEKDRPEPPDEMTLGLQVDDKPLAEILQKLYFPESPYEFSVFPAEILGQVYEQFLGKVIRLTKGHQAKVEEKPEVRKAGGVYYTPAYIVDYIVRHTVGKLLDRRTTFQVVPQDAAAQEAAATYKVALRDSPSAKPITPAQAAKLRILDPACGSGSFLIRAYQYLLDWHRDWYTTDGPEKHARGRNPKLYRGPADDWRLTTAEKKRILLNNIYGVDIDRQAVEVTKLSLLLKVLEGESKETVNNQLRLLRERALPDLAANIKCGNSLIGPDFYNGRQMSLLDDEERYRVNVFDWRAEFPGIFKAGGFDAMIGNPPYVRMEAFKELKDYLRSHYRSHDERSDLYVYFMEKEHDLLQPGGKFGMIVSNKFLRANYGAKIRRLILEVAGLDRVVDLAGLRVFGKPTVRTVLVLSTKGGDKGPTRYSPPPGTEPFMEVQSGTRLLDDVVDPLTYEVERAKLIADTWNLGAPHHAALMERLARDSIPLLKVVGSRICRGVVSGLTEAFVISGAKQKAILRRNARAREIIRPFIQGRNIRRYRIEPNDEYLIYTYHGIDMARYPAVLEHLRPFKERLEERATKQPWYELQQPQYAYRDMLAAPKIVFPDIATTCRFAIDTGGHFGANTVYFLPSDDLRLLGLLNSKVAYFYFKQTCAALEGPGEAYLRFFGQYMEDFPVPRTAGSDKRRGRRMMELAETMLALDKKLSAARTADDQTALQRQIDATDRQIDQLVYELYGLTDAEIRTVEEATRG
jgi:predicted type IV restriction endonuclease